MINDDIMTDNPVAIRIDNEKNINKLSILAVKDHEKLEIRLNQKIRHGKYVIGMSAHPARMLIALCVEFVIGFLAIITASGKLQTKSTIVSFLYLLNMFSSSKTKNSKWVCKVIFEYYMDNVTDRITLLWFILRVIFRYIPLSIPLCIALDFAQLHRDCATFETISFATADLVVVIASINYASRSPYLSDSIPLLVSFDFITKFSSALIQNIPITDEEAITKSEEALSWRNQDEIKRKWLPGLIMVIIVAAAVALAGALSSSSTEYNQVS